MDQGPEEIRGDVEATLDRMTRTVDAIAYKVNVPARAREAASRRTEAAAEQVPGGAAGAVGGLVAVAAAVGAVLLFLRRRRRRRERQSRLDALRTGTSLVADYLDTIGERARDAGERARDIVSR